MKTIPNWQDKIIEVAHSKGGVLATVNPMDNLIRGQLSLWPPPEIVQKLYRSRQERAFEGADLAAATSILGFYSDLQSLHSEDALTWSIFGTLAYASPRVRCDFTNSLLNFLNINVHPVSAVNVWLWRRLPHPDTLVSGGPEIDFGIQTEHVVILGEAKWLSSVGGMQGKAKNKDQITLRQEFLEKYGQAIFGTPSLYIVLGVSLLGGMLKSHTLNLKHASLHSVDITWKSVCNIECHPISEEIKRYIEWKEKNSNIAKRLWTGG